MPEQTPKPDEFGRLRVTDKDTGYKRSIPASALPHGNYTVLKQPASDINGDPLPPEFPESTTSGQQAEPKKEA